MHLINNAMTQSVRPSVRGAGLAKSGPDWRRCETYDYMQKVLRSSSGGEHLPPNYTPTLIYMQNRFRALNSLRICGLDVFYRFMSHGLPRSGKSFFFLEIYPEICNISRRIIMPYIMYACESICHMSAGVGGALK